MRIIESRESFAKRAQEDFKTELDKVLGCVERDPMFQPVMALVRVARVLHSRLKNLEDWMIEDAKEEAKRRNRFHKCNSVSEVVAQAVGAGSTAWVGGTGSAEFDSEEATAISVEATERIEQLMRNQ